MTVAVQSSPLVLLSRPAQPALHPLRILHLEDSEADSAVVRRYLERQGFGGHTVHVDCRESFLDQLACDFDVVLADHSMPGFDSCEALRLVQEQCPAVPFIIVSGTITEEAAVESIKSGASDYIWKDRLQRLGPAIESALRERRHRTEHEEALRARRESEALSNAVLASLSQLICVLGPDGVIVRTNASWKSAGAARGTNGLTGLDVGTNYLDVCRRAAGRGDGTALAALAGITAVLACEQDEFSMEYPCHGPTGRAWFTMNVTPLGGGLGAVLSHQSITDLRISQESLIQNQARLEAIYEGSVDAILLADDDGRYVDANPAASALLGYSNGEFLKMGVTDVMSIPADQDFDERWAALRARGTDSGEFVLYRKDGTAVEVEQRATFNVMPGLHLSVIRDVTERKAAEAALAEASRQNAEILESIGDGFYALDADWRFSYVNAQAGVFLKQEPESLIGQLLWEEFPAALDGPLETHYRRVVETGCAEAFELYYPAPLDAHYAVRAFPYKEGVTVYFRDVTEEKRAETALRESKSQFVQIADAMPQLVWTTDPQGRNDYFNERWYAYSGMARPTEPGATAERVRWVDYLHPDDVERLFARWTHSLATGEPYEVEHRFRRTDGAYRWFIGRAMPVRDETGAVVRWFGTCTDIHDLRDAREELRKSGERLRLVSHATNDAVWDWDMRTGQFVTNPAFGEIFGWRDEAATGFDNAWMVERMHPDDRALAFATFRAIMAGTETSWRSEHRFERADGTWADVLERGYILRENGVPVRTVGSMLDLSAQKATERALIEAKEAAEEVARAKSSLLMNMSHEIRTPLTAVIGYAELLGDECGPEQTAQREYAAAIENGGRRLLDTLNSVLDLAQIEAGGFPLATVAVDLRAESEAAVFALQPLAQADGLALTLTGSSTAARADRPALARVLTNLVGNAIKFTERGTVSVDVWSEGGSAWLRVSDTGVGIAASFLPHVFDDFKQESSGENRSHEGSGLGLAITWGLVTTMGGEITVASEKGVGSTFTVRLPAA